MLIKYPRGMRLTQWRRTPFRMRHRLLAFAINDALGHWRSCADRRCRRARGCQDHECYWRRLEQMTYEEQMRMREAAAPLAKLLRIGCIKGSEGRPPNDLEKAESTPRVSSARQQCRRQLPRPDSCRRLRP